MKKLLLVPVLLLPTLWAAPAGAQLQAGAANADITPPIGTPMFAYTARSNLAGGRPEEVALQIVADPDSGLYAKTFAPSRGIHTRVRSRALVLESGGTRLALVQVDIGGIPLALVQRVGDLIAETGIPLENVVVAATHSHSSTGPIWPTESTGYAALGGDAYDARIFEFTARGIARSIVVANSYKVPAKLGIAKVEIRDASRNRSFEPFQQNADVPKDEKAARLASIDPNAMVIRVDETDGRPIGTWSNFALHQTSFDDDNLLFSGDNAAFAERIVEAAIRADARARRKPARRPETVVNVFTNAAEGDISPSGDTDKEPMDVPETAPGEQPPKPESLQYSSNSFTSAHMAGLKVARGVLKGWRRAGRSMTADVPLGARLGFVTFDGEEAEGEPVGPNAVLGAGGIAADDGACAPFDNAAGPGQGRKQALLGGPGDSLVPATQAVSVLRVGSLGIAAFPAELNRQMGGRIIDAVKGVSRGAFQSVAIAGLANGYVSYAATPEEYDACHYEGSFTLFGRRQGPLFRDVAVDLAEALIADRAYEGDPQPQYAAPAGGEFPEPSPTPNAGTPVKQPAKSVVRYGRMQFSWNGGHPSIDAPRAGRLVTTQRFGPRRWNRFTSDDGFYDILEREPESDLWTTTFQTTDCMPLGRYRFLVRGRADKGDGAKDYRIESDPFEIRPITGIKPTLTITGRRARVTAIYPDPGEDVLLALPRRVQSGSAVLGVKRGRRKEKRVRARLTKDRLAFTARVPRGATVRVIRVKDACGNTSA